MKWLFLFLLTACYREERVPDLDHSLNFEGPRLTLSYPGNWKILTHEHGYDPASHFRIQGPGGYCNVMFELHEPPIDLRSALEKIAKQRVLIVKQPEIHHTNNWGRNVGQGIHIAGVFEEESGNRIHYRLFGMQRRLVTVTIVEECPESRLSVAQAGFELIAMTFTLR